jgi:hypothetical protein
MKTPTRLALALALVCGAAAIGCGADPAAMPNGSGNGSNNGSDGGDDDPGTPPVKPLDATGKYAVHSTFDLATNMPGTAGTVVNTIIAATDGDDDPTAWIVDQLIAQLPAGRAKDLINQFKFLIVGVLNDKLRELAPDFAITVIQVGHDFGEIAKNFGLNETLELTRSGDGYVAVHTVTGVHFKLGNQDDDFAFANYHATNVVVNNVAVTMDTTGQLTIAAHDVPLRYGQLLRIGLDAAIIPQLDSSAQSLNDLLAHLVNCDKVGDAIASAIEDIIGVSPGAGVFTTACRAGLDAGAKLIYHTVDDIDAAALKFDLSGSARGSDKNKDRNIDTIQTGTWAGTLDYAGTPAPLVPATFFGERM